jgi:gluconolactonase
MKRGWVARSTAGLLWILAAGQAVAADTTEKAVGMAALCGECRAEHYAHCGVFVEGPNFDRDGRLWTVDYRGGGIIEIVDGICRTVANTGGQANGSRFDKDGRLFVADAQRGLLIFDPRTKMLSVRAATVAGKPIVGANDLVFDQAGGLYMTARNTATRLEPNGMVIYLPPGEKSEPRILADGLPFPNGIALSADGTRLFVGLYADKSVIVLPPADRPLPYLTSWTYLHTEGGVGPDGMTVDVDGRLWWANFGDGAISVAGPTGRFIGRIELPPEAGKGTTNVTVHDGYLYITEALKGDIWRVRLTPAVKPKAS